MLGVSRQPISHALQILKRQGLVNEHGKRGLQIAPLEPGRIRDLYEVRQALDGLAAESAARRVRSGRLSKAEATEAERILNAGLALEPHAAMGERVAADVAFHSALHGLSGNSAIAETVAEQWPHFMRSMRLVLANDETRRRVWTEHTAILDAVLAGHPERAGEAARAHAATASEETVRRLDATRSVA